MDNLLVASNQRRMIRHGSLSLDLNGRRLSCAGVAVPTTPGEFNLLALLIARQDIPMTKDAILSEVFGSGGGHSPYLVDVLIARLRRSLAPHGLDGMICTVAGRGYAVSGPQHDLTPFRPARPHACREALLAA